MPRRHDAPPRNSLRSNGLPSEFVARPFVNGSIAAAASAVSTARAKWPHSISLCAKDSNAWRTRWRRRSSSNTTQSSYQPGSRCIASALMPTTSRSGSSVLPSPIRCVGADTSAESTVEAGSRKRVNLSALRISVPAHRKRHNGDRRFPAARAFGPSGQSVPASSRRLTRLPFSATKINKRLLPSGISSRMLCSITKGSPSRSRVVAPMSSPGRDCFSTGTSSLPAFKAAAPTARISGRCKTLSRNTPTVVNLLISPSRGRHSLRGRMEGILLGRQVLWAQPRNDSGLSVRYEVDRRLTPRL
jgi:hypothetical protein